MGDDFQLRVDLKRVSVLCYLRWCQSCFSPCNRREICGCQGFTSEMETAVAQRRIPLVQSQ
jgi:hypothetical protein